MSMPQPFLRRLAPFGVAAALAAGGLALAGCGAAGSAAAAGGDVAAAATSADTAASTAITGTATDGGPRQGAAYRAAMQAALDKLVSAGTLTSAQESAVAAALQPQAGSRSGSFSRSRTGTATFSRGGGRPPAGLPPARKAALDALVQQGTITAAQEDAVIAAVQQAGPFGRPSGASTSQGG